MRSVPLLAICTVVAVLAGGCGGSGHSAASTSTTVDTTPLTSPPVPVSDKASVQEVTDVGNAIHKRFPQFCRGLKFALDITNDPSQHLPRPGAGGSCTMFKETVRVLAFTKPADRDTYVRRWTAMLCTRSNKSDRTYLYGTSWVLRPRSATNLVTPDTAQVLAALAHGNFHYQSCTPATPPELQTATTSAIAIGAQLSAAGMDCGPVAPAVANAVYSGNALVDAKSKLLVAVLARCAHQADVFILAPQPGLAVPIADGVISGVKSGLCAQDRGTRFVRSGYTIVATADAALARQAAGALSGSSTSSC